MIRSVIIMAALLVPAEALEHAAKAQAIENRSENFRRLREQVRRDAEALREATLYGHGSDTALERLKQSTDDLRYEQLLERVRRDEEALTEHLSHNRDGFNEALRRLDQSRQELQNEDVKRATRKAARALKIDQSIAHAKNNIAGLYELFAIDRRSVGDLVAEVEQVGFLMEANPDDSNIFWSKTLESAFERLRRKFERALVRASSTKEKDELKESMSSIINFAIYIISFRSDTNGPWNFAFDWFLGRVARLDPEVDWPHERYGTRSASGDDIYDLTSPTIFARCVSEYNTAIRAALDKEALRLKIEDRKRNGQELIREIKRHLEVKPGAAKLLFGQVEDQIAPLIIASFKAMVDSKSMTAKQFLTMIHLLPGDLCLKCLKYVGQPGALGGGSAEVAIRSAYNESLEAAKRAAGGYDHSAAPVRDGKPAPDPNDNN
jgi:hypothetical protein